VGTEIFALGLRQIRVQGLAPARIKVSQRSVRRQEGNAHASDRKAVPPHAESKARSHVAQANNANFAFH
jgi:hypothetical protein